LQSSNNKFNAILKNSGLRITEQRQAVLDDLYNSDGHRDVEEIFISLKNNGLNVSRATVYRTLEILVNHKLVRRLDLGEGKFRFESRDRSHHDHIICINCNKIVEFMNVHIEELQEKIAKKNGFILKRHVHQLFGICKDCN
tara:strand:+ start:193 stop:615 length:423 start_codon:yes stop_codon:yes gene_type:complete